MNTITKVLLLLFLGFFQSQAIAQCAPQISYTGVSSQYNLNTPITPLNLTNTGGAFSVSNATIDFNTPIAQPTGITIDGNGNLYVLESANNQLKKITPNGIITIIVGGFNAPRGICIDNTGVIYVADTGNNSVKKIATDNSVTTIGSGFISPRGVAVDTAGNVYVADTGNNAIKKIDTSNMVSIAVSGLSVPSGVAVDTLGNLYVAETGINSIKKITPENVSSILGFGFQFPEALTVDSNGVVYLCDTGNNAVKKISPSNQVTNLAGSYSGPKGITVDANGNVYISDTNNNAVEKVTPGNIATSLTHVSGQKNIAIDNLNSIYLLDRTNRLVRKRNSDGSQSIVVADLTSPNAIAIDQNGNVFVSDAVSNSSNLYNIKKITASGTVTIIASNILVVRSIAADTLGNVFVVDFNSLKKIDANNIVTTVNTTLQGTPILVTAYSLGSILVTDGSTIVKIIGNEVETFATTFSESFTSSIRTLNADVYGNLYVGDFSNNLIKFDLFGNRALNLSFAFNAESFALDSLGRIFFTTNNVFPVTRNNLFRIRPNLPSGLTMNYSTGQITGTPTVASPTTTYTISIANDCGMASTDISFGICNNSVAINSQTASAFVCQGNSKQLSVQAVGCNLSYQWYKDNNLISGANNATLTIANFSTQEVASYHCVVTGSSGNVSSNPIVLSLNNSPAIIYSNVSNTYVSGTAITPLTPLNTGGTVSPSENTSFGLLPSLGVTTDADGNVYVAEYTFNTKIRKITPNGIVTTFGPTLSYPKELKIDISGNLYVLEETGNNRKILKIQPNGASSIVVGNLNFPRGLAVDHNYNIYYTESNFPFIRKRDPNGNITQIGSGLTSPTGIAVDTNGDVFVIDANNSTVKKINNTGTVTTIGTIFSFPQDLALDRNSNLYVADFSSIKKVSQNNTVTTITNPATIPVAYKIALDTNEDIYIVDGEKRLQKLEAGGTVTTLVSGFSQVLSLTHDNNGNTYLCDIQTLQKINNDGIATTISLGGNANSPDIVAVDAANTIYVANEYGSIYYKTENGPTTLFKSSVGKIKYMVVDGSGNVYIKPENGNTITKISPNGSMTIVGSGFSSPNGIAIDAQDNLYIADTNNNAVKKISPTGVITSLGNGFNQPYDVTVDAAGVVYVADSGNNAIKRISTDGTVSVITTAFSNPREISIDGLGNLYVLTDNNTRVNRISNLTNYSISPALPAGLSINPENGTISGIPTTTSIYTNYTIQTGNSCGTTSTTIGFGVCAPPAITNQLISKSICEGDTTTFGVTATGCDLQYQWLFNGNIIPDANAAVYTINSTSGTDSGNYSCEITSPYGSTISNTALLNVLIDVDLSYPEANANYTRGVEITPLTLTLNGGNIITNDLNVTNLNSVTTWAQDITMDEIGNFYMVSYTFTGIKKRNLNGEITTLYSELGNLNVITIDAQNNLYVANTLNSIIKKITPEGIISDIGTGIFFPRGLDADQNGVVYVTDSGNNAVKKIHPDGTTTTLATGFNSPNGLKVNEDGNVYVADTNNNTIKLISPTGVVSIVATDISYVLDVDTDNRGNVYFIQQYSGIVRKLNTQGITSFITNFSNNPLCLFSDGEGVLYLSLNNGQDKKIIQGVTYTVSPTLPNGMTLDRLTGTISGTPEIFTPNTTYTVSIDTGCNQLSTTLSFSTCGPILIFSQPISQTLCDGLNTAFTVQADACNINYQWYKDNQPIAGATSNSLEFYSVSTDDSGDYSCLVTGSEDSIMSDTATLVVNARPNPIYSGVASGYYLNQPMNPLIPVNTGGVLFENNYTINTYREVPNTFMNDFAKDNQGNFYICDTYSNTIKKVETNGNITIVNNSIIQPNSIAVDSVGNVYVTHPGSNSVIKIDSNGNLSTLVSSLNFPSGIGIDASNNLYVSEVNNNTVKKISPTGTVISNWTLPSNPYSLAITSTGIVYAATYSGYLYKIENDVISQLPYTFGYSKLSAMSDGTIYTGGSYTNIQKINPDGSLENLPITLYHDYKILSDGNNNLYFFDNNTSNIKKMIGPSFYSISPALPEGMEFNYQTGTISGTPTALTPTTTYTITTQNSCGFRDTYLTFAVCTATVITQQPQSKIVCAGTSVSFEVIGSGSDITYQWLKNNVPIAGATQSVLTLPFPTDGDVADYSCLVSGNCGSATSETASLMVVNNNSSAISAQPTNAYLCKANGSTASFSVATIMPAATYTWQYRVVSSANLNPSWITITNSVNGVYSGFTTTTLTVTKTSTSPANGTQYRVIVNGTCGSVTSDIASVFVVSTLAAGTISVPTSVCLGNDITFTLSGYSGTSLQWQSAPNATGTFTNISGANQPTYTLNSAQTNSNLSYRVVVYNACENTSVTSAIKTIKVDLPSIAGTVSGGGIICPSGTATVRLAGYRGRIQWEYATDGVNFVNVPTASAGMTVPFSTTSTNNQSTSYTVSNLTTDVYLRVKVTNGSCSAVFSNAVQYTIVNSATAGYISPSTNTICAGTGTTLQLFDSVGSVVWERSTDLITWYNTAKTGTSFATGNITLNTAYRAKVTVNGCSSVYSAPVWVNLQPKPLAKSITANATSPSGRTALTAMCTDDTTKVLTIGNGYVGTIQWQVSTTSTTLGFTDIPGAVNQSYTVLNPTVGANYFRAKFTNSCGVSTFSAAVTVHYKSCTIAKLVETKNSSIEIIAYPNPYSDTFQFNLNTKDKNDIRVAVYDMTGKLIEQSVFNPMTITEQVFGKNYASGVYNVIVSQGEHFKTIRIIKR
jgi:sugar lactone lactonase YvrE